MTWDGGDESRVQALIAENERLRKKLEGERNLPRGTTYDLWYFFDQENGSWVVKCEEHKAWKLFADSYEEAEAKAPTSFKRHHSRHLAFRHWVVGSVST